MFWARLDIKGRVQNYCSNFSKFARIPCLVACFRGKYRSNVNFFLLLLKGVVRLFGCSVNFNYKLFSFLLISDTLSNVNNKSQILHLGPRKSFHGFR